LSPAISRSAIARIVARLIGSPLVVALVVLGAAPSARAATDRAGLWKAGSPGGSGGVPIGGLAPTPKPKVPPAPSKRAHGTWMRNATITEYWPAPESWFVGRLVSTPGLTGKHRIDWLYSASGVSMEGEGIGLDGRMYHIDSLGDGGWVASDGAPTSAGDGWAGGPPYWRAGGYWTNRSGAVTFPLGLGGWRHGPGRQYVPLPGVTFARGASLPLSFYQSVAVDPKVIPLGSRVYIPAYRHDGHGGWFIAQDTGGAISGTHVDVYRTPPGSPNDSGQLLTGQRIFVIKAHR
jgi:3D (Asp-Asp-Asp) domain-containing protein